MSGATVVSLHVTTESGESTHRVMDALARVAAGFVLDGLAVAMEGEPIIDDNEEQETDGDE